jgi:FkbM family methyltransferase
MEHKKKNMLKIIRKLVLWTFVKISQYRGKSFADKLANFIDDIHRKINNVNFDMERNGEIRALQILSSHNLRCIFDVGANVGDWSLVASQFNPNAKIYAFEIVPSTYNVLIKNTKEFKNIKASNFGLSDSNDIIKISIGQEDSSTATACPIEGMKYHNEYYTKTLDCQAKTASSVIKEFNLDSINFVKIDVEGMDLKVIKGFENEINKVDVIQFEYGIFNISSHDLLVDFCNYLNNNGFVVGKIFPRFVSFFEYDMHMENFHGGNFLAVKKCKSSLK